jgi:thiol-disulfide isomerase/thioredoxin
MTSNQIQAPRWLAILCAALSMGAHGCAAWRARPEPGQPAPALAGTLLDGRPFALAALRGQVVLVNFWATWCGPCRDEMPWLDAFYQQHRAQGFTLVGVSQDARRDRAQVAQAAGLVHYPALLRGDASENGFGEQPLLPVSYLIDRSGVIAARLAPDQGALDEQRLEALVLPLLKRGP